MTNGNYVVASSGWDNGSAAINAGAVTWGNGNGGTIGLINSSNSLIGSLTNDAVGSSGITALSNSNYVVGSSNWNAGRGAATWGNGNGGTIGVVNSGNSLVGFNPTIQLLTGDQVSSSGITALTNGNYVVGSGNWSSNDGYGHEGAATWGNGATGSIGTVSATNSLVGSFFNDRVSSRGITALTN
ncbi:MAG: hypothetical protein NTW85_14810 [Methylococcales bacterium]|nr:hypothetical protein [Methylococcales bacterium]